MKADTRRRIAQTVTWRMQEQWKNAKVCPTCGSKFRGKYETKCWRCRLKETGKV